MNLKFQCNINKVFILRILQLLSLLIKFAMDDE